MPPRRNRDPDDHQGDLRRTSTDPRTERAVSLTLQRWLLPPDLPDVEGLRFATLYRAGRDELAVGGDWYDVIPVEGGTALVVGDVVGHNARSAAEMGQVRHVLASHLHATGDVAQSLATTDRYYAARAADTMATAVAMLVDHSAQRVELASAGHPAPILVPATRPPQVLDVEPGPPLGSGFGGYRSTTVAVEAGSVLVAYTDGLVEARDVPLDAAIHELRDDLDDLLTGTDGPPSESLDGVAALLARRGDDPDRVDDIAALVVGLR